MEKIEIVNFDNCPTTNRIKAYGGASGNKYPIIYNGEEWLLKYPRYLMNLNRKNQVLPYSNSPLSEFLGSKIYEILGFNVHKTILGVSKELGHITVACKDFLNKGDRLYEFREIKVTGIPTYNENEKVISDKYGINLDEATSHFKTNAILQKFMPNIEKHFWDMFVVDAFIGNADRNNGNWGIIVKLDETAEIAPIYDNGASFYPNMDEKRMDAYLQNEHDMINIAYKGSSCVFTETNENGEEKLLNAYRIISSKKYPNLNQSIINIVPIISKKINEICDLIDSIPDSYDGIKIMSDTQKKFHTKVIKMRLNDVFLPVYNDLLKG